jgi:hypothetical protein
MKHIRLRRRDVLIQGLEVQPANEIIADMFQAVLRGRIG